MPEVLSPNDRFAIYDTLFRYAWSLDRKDADGIASCFTADGVIVSATNDVRWEGTRGLKEFGYNAFKMPGFAGRQHHIQPNVFEKTEEGYKVTSYWMVVTWAAGAAPHIVSLGWYEDRLVQQDGAWLLKEKIIRRWDSDIAPMVG
jgi:hypothetical protein